MSGVPVPKFVFRGHQKAVHSATFVRKNERLVTGDSDGYVVLWDLMTMRAKAVWRAHEKAILGLQGWGDDKLITHGRDHKLIVWKIQEDDETRLSTALPLDGPSVDRPQPWVLHLLEVNTMNFCSFAACPAAPTGHCRFLDTAPEILVAVPNTLASEAIDIYSLPSQQRLHTIKTGASNGMAMSLAVFHHLERLTLIGAFENGYASVHQLSSSTAAGTWVMTYRSQAHSQPVLSLDVRPDMGCFFTSSADAIIAKHPVPTQPQARAAGPAQRPGQEPPPGGAKGKYGDRPDSESVTAKEWQHPKKVVNTKHAGQQSLCVRSDGALFATAGWDSKIRVYSCKTMKELAVLKWHKEGAYAVTFSNVGPGETQMFMDSERGGQDGTQSDAVDVSRLTVTDRRSHRAKTAHWVAAGAKDGRVSLWDIY